MSTSEKRLPEIIVFAGPNGSGKTTLGKIADTVGVYINADEIKKATLCSDLEAAIKAEELREERLEKNQDFTFETVLSTDRNLKLLKKAKKKGYFIKCFFVLTDNYEINISRVNMRTHMGGHDVPKDKIKSRFQKSINMIPELIRTCDIVHIYDNTQIPFRIFKKRKSAYSQWENEYWNFKDIEKITGIKEGIN